MKLDDQNQDADLYAMRDVYLKLITEETRKFYQDHNTASKVKRQVRDTLDKDRDNIVAKVLGFDNRWRGEWEIDHCNGRESPLSQLIKTEAEEAAKVWIKDCLHTKDLPALTNQQKKAIQIDYADRFKRYLNDELSDRIRKAASEVAAKLAVEIVEPYLLKLQTAGSPPDKVEEPEAPF